MHGNLNLLTQRLMQQGYTEADPPKGYRWGWNGWEYNAMQRNNIVIITPCGLIGKGTEAIDVGWDGTDWTLENENPVIPCPWGQGELFKTCTRRKPMPRNLCTCKIGTNTNLDWSRTIRMAKDEMEAYRRQKLAEYAETHGMCPFMTRFDDSTGKVVQYHSIADCASQECQYCSLFGRENDKAKANVYYDLVMSKYVDYGNMLPGEWITTKRKGIKFFDRQVPVNICKRLLSKQSEIVERQSNKSEISIAEFFAKYHNMPFKWHIENVRMEKRESRDLMQDLQDAKDGITVIHASDVERTKAEKKRADRKARQERKKRKIDKRIAELNDCVDKQLSFWGGEQ